MKHVHDMPFGAALLPQGGVRFRIWAPSVAGMRLLLGIGSGERRLDMQPAPGGWHEITVSDAVAGDRYSFVTPDGLCVPDPASRSNPDDVHGASMVVDARAFDWQSDTWAGRPWHEAVVYELHIGTFTAGGTYLSALDKLEDLAALGVTAIELLPLADFPGARGWGYDGVLQFAPDSAYGTPDELKRFIDAAHALKMIVLLDVVYNHFGPEGNYLHAYCQEFFNPAHQTPWGAAINFDGDRNETVRDFYVQNALFWVEEYRFDGLRMDAIHQIMDDSDLHICQQIGQALRAGPGATRHVHLILENDRNEASKLARDEEGRPILADAQWNDDFHHPAHVLATGESDGYYIDYADAPLALLGRSLSEGFGYQGEPSKLRDGEARGEPSAHLPGTAFISFLQNHDQIGNRAFGERIGVLADKAGRGDRLQALYAALLLSPHVPMLFMGEEFAASAPFLYFCDFEHELAAAVLKGRHDEFARFEAFADSAVLDRLPVPNDKSTFDACKLDWAQRHESPHSAQWALIRELLSLRREQLMPRLAGAMFGGRHRVDGDLLQVHWVFADGAVWHMALNVGNDTVAAARKGDTVFALRADAHGLQPNGVRVSVERTGGGLMAEAEEADSDVPAAALEADPQESPIAEEDDDTVTSRWCERVGLATFYDDIWGTRHAVSHNSLMTLLREFGVDDPSAAALRKARAADWRSPLPPLVSITTGDASIAIVARLPSSNQPIAWRLTEEGGKVHTGELDRATCKVVDRTIGRVALQLDITVALPSGYHRLQVGEHDATVIVAPKRCYRPPALQGEGRVWGPAVQLYSLQSERNWGIGDFTDLARLADTFADRGASIVGVNPLHALFPHNPGHISPYSPSSRSQLNVLYIDVENIDDYAECEPARQLVRSDAFQAHLALLRGTLHVDYPAVSAAKFAVLPLLYRSFRERHLDALTERGQTFRAWMAERGESLALHATHEALQSRFHGESAVVWGPPMWPEGYRHFASPAVTDFRETHADEVEFFAWLQWQADQQLGQVARRLRERGLAVGLYLDLAVSVDRAGSDFWGHSDLYAPHATVGAPPDALAPDGQDWGLPPLLPTGMQSDRLGFVIETLRANMRHAGAVRVDHVLGLMRLFWIPPEGGGRNGSYVRYPLRDLLAAIALESERNRCMVIGEDLGTVAPELRTALSDSEVLSYRLLYFERGERGSFKPPGAYPREALVAIGTHDLPTLTGWWKGHDLMLRRQLGSFSEDTFRNQQADRAHEREELLWAVKQSGVWPQGLGEPAGQAADDVTLIRKTAASALTQPLVDAIHAHAASAPSRVMVMQLEDALGVLDQPNLPGTVNEHPNWRQKIPLTLEALDADKRLTSVTQRIADIRPTAPQAAASTRIPSHTQAVVPRATYRLQFHKEFDFDQGIAVLPYLQRLGISHVYASPLMRARPGSMHGYDVVSHNEINPELGGMAGFDRFSAALKLHGMGLVLDMVPNHMGIGNDNPWWMDVLEHGQSSTYARYFDIDWQPIDAPLHGKVLLPVLGEQYGKVLDDGELTLAFEPDTGSFLLRYFDHRLPIDPATVAQLLRHAALACSGGAAQALREVAAGFASLPDREISAAPRRADRARPLKARLAALAAEQPAALQAIEHSIAAMQSPEQIDALHEAQAWRLASWRVASDEINYRRFFDINDLAALRIEEPAVFESTHAFALDLCAAGKVDGLRIDHPDGLHDPAQYFERLQRGYAERKGFALPPPDASGRPARPLYVVAEKIAAGHENIPESWALHGTTGYRFVNVVNGVLIDTTSRERFDRAWHRFSGESEDFHELSYRGKRGVMRNALASELTVLAAEALRIARAHRRTRDFTFNTLREALAEVAACMPVYRTYIVDAPSAQDLRFVDWAVAEARRRQTGGDGGIYHFLRQTLLARAVDGADAELQERVRRFAMRFQQFSAPVTAKGVEDTAFYRYHRLIALNEVGGEPAVFGLTLKGFHAASADRAARWPHTMAATSTHDNKRSEDVRCRLDVLSELPSVWRLWLRRFVASPQLQRERIPPADGEESATPIPSRADEYLLLQTLLGTLPAGGLTDDSIPGYRDRIVAYATKASREAKRHTSWVSPNADYESGLTAFIGSVLGRVKPNPALTELQTQAEALAWFGSLNSLSMIVLKNLSPGVPDLYQGNELMDLSLVDPDNRRPVDYGLRSGMLDELQAIIGQPDWRPALRTLAANPHDGRLKLWLTWRLLQLRKDRSSLFRDGAYRALSTRGSAHDHVVAFGRELADDSVIAVTGRLYSRLMSMQANWPAGAQPWGDTVLELPSSAPGALLCNTLTGETHLVRDGRVPLAELFATLPMAALVRV